MNWSDIHDIPLGEESKLFIKKQVVLMLLRTTKWEIE